MTRKDCPELLSRADAQAGKKLKSAALKGGKNATKTEPGPRKSDFMGSRHLLLATNLR